MTDIKKSVCVGGIIGCLYGVTLYASIDSLALASVILYGDPYVIPAITTATISVIAIVGTLTYKVWLPYAERLFDDIRDIVTNEDIGEDED